MTVVLALRCADGLVLGSDSQITDAGGGMSYPGEKLHPLGDRAAWGGSGFRGALADIGQRFSESAAAILEADDAPQALQREVLPVLRAHYEAYIDGVPGEKTQVSPSAYVLAAGYTHDQPWIVEINPNGMVSRYDDIGFHAVGSGAPMAHQAGSLLAHFRMTQRPVAYGIVAVVRVLGTLMETAPSVGGPIDVYRITPEDAHHLDDHEIEQARKHVQRWIDLEQEALDTLFD